MPTLPPDRTPLYHHPLPALEAWLLELGARQLSARSALWDLHRPQWSARIELGIEELQVSWQHDGQERIRHFSYGLTRSDVEAAILAGP
jgi:hypothetical protein